MEWNEMHKNRKFRPKYPSEQVVQYVFRNFKRDGTEKILDMGCGAGRHTAFMADENIIPYGIDYSESGTFYTRETLINKGFPQYTENIKISDATDLPFPDNYFDGLISYGVLYYLKFDAVKKSISEIKRVLKVGGRAFVVVRSIDDYRAQYGLRTEERNTLIINENDETKCASNENGMIMHFFDREELVELFSEFNNVKIDRIEVTHDNETFHDSNYVISIEKGD